MIHSINFGKTTSMVGGVDGSSPSEGLKSLQIAYFCCLFRRDQEESMEGGRVHQSFAGTFREIRRPTLGGGNFEGTRPSLRGTRVAFGGAMRKDRRGLCRLEQLVAGRPRGSTS
jgi:hypothetical protein